MIQHLTYLLKSSDKTDCNISASDEGVEKVNCCIQPMLEVVTVRYIAINEKSTLNYNRN